MCVFHTFQVATSAKSENEREREHFARLARMSANPFNLHYDVQQNFLANVLLMCTIRKSNWNFALCNDCFTFFSAYVGPVFHQCPLNINVHTHRVYIINENNHHAAIESGAVDAAAAAG